MHRPPRPTDARIFGRELMLLGLKQGAALSVLLLARHYAARLYRLDNGQTRTLMFTAMIVGVVWLLFLNRSWTLTLATSVRLPNRALW